MGPVTQEDPIGIAGGLNLYDYANGDPINFSDPFWLCIWDICTVESALVSGLSYANIRFGDLMTLLLALGFVEEGLTGRHHIFTLEARRAALNLQPDGSKARAYQVKQVRDVILKYGLGSHAEE